VVVVFVDVIVVVVVLTVGLRSSSLSVDLIKCPCWTPLNAH
jgi:hypothetical protein